MESPLRPTALSEQIEIIETFEWPGRPGRIARHLARAARSCAALGFAFDRAAVETALNAVSAPHPLRLRLSFAASGAVAVSHAPKGETAALWRIALAPERLRSGDPWLRHKTTRRALYDRTRAQLPTGIDERIFLNEHGEICEGTITNLFFDLGAGLCTPPLSCGLLPGILREELLQIGRCREAVLSLADLPDARLWLGNSLRGLIPGAYTPASPSSAAR